LALAALTVVTVWVTGHAFVVILVFLTLTDDLTGPWPLVAAG
jgi:hypothetical protein